MEKYKDDYGRSLTREEVEVELYNEGHTKNEVEENFYDLIEGVYTIWEK